MPDGVPPAASDVWPVDTPMLGTRYCPGCQPEVDPTREIAYADWCGDHHPSRDGRADAHAVSALWMPPVNGDVVNETVAMIARCMRHQGQIVEV